MQEQFSPKRFLVFSGKVFALFVLFPLILQFTFHFRNSLPMTILLALFFILAAFVWYPVYAGLQQFLVVLEAIGRALIFKVLLRPFRWRPRV